MGEKAIVFDIQRASLHDGPGIRTTVFLKGCLLECLWCHNPEAVVSKRQLFFHFDKCTLCGDCAKVCEFDVHHIADGRHTIDYDKCTFCGKCVESCNSNALKIIGKEMSVDEVMLEVMADFDFYTNSGGGITLSGGEPLLHFSFSMELLQQCKEMGISTCVETSGFVSEVQFRQFFPFIDILLFDYKISDSEEHRKYTGVPNESILSNLDLAYHAGIPIILRCPVIPGINDTEEHFRQIRALDKNYPDLKGIELLPYHDVGNNKRTSIGSERTLADLNTTPPEVSGKWLKQLKEMGCSKARIG
jgi:glycyl-radical enzyme activating protein